MSHNTYAIFEKITKSDFFDTIPSKFGQLVRGIYWRNCFPISIICDGVNLLPLVILQR